MANAKIALTMERQLTYVLNPARNKGKLPIYLITNQEKSGLLSGYMITQYSANALTQKICQLGIPSAIFNITSANESEDIVSYGATAGQRILEQLGLMNQLSVIYLTTMAQAYAIARRHYLDERGLLDPSILTEKIFDLIQEKMGQDFFPTSGDDPFASRYEAMGSILDSLELRKKIAFPISNYLNLTPSLFRGCCQI
jgi:histidine ammonia-lyase